MITYVARNRLGVSIDAPKDADMLVILDTHRYHQQYVIRETEWGGIEILRMSEGGVTTLYKGPR